MTLKEIEETKKRIDKMSYTELLSGWRFHPVGDPYFQGEVGEHYARAMKERRASISNAEHVAASKAIGWER